MTDVILEARDVHKTFQISAGAFRPRRPLHAVNGVSLKVHRGEVLGLVGESGCGKTTLAKMLLGLLPPSSGELLIDGEPVGDAHRLHTARMIQPIFQDPYSSLNPRKTVGAIITLPLKVQNEPNPESWRKRVDDILDLVGLPKGVYGNYPNQLSGGQRQRVAVARALINRPQVVICDEPTSALDVSVQSQILNLLQDLRMELGLTYVLISHNLAVVEHMATRMAVMYLGRVVERGESQRMFKDPRHPYTRALLQSVLTPEPDLGIPDAQLGAVYPNPVDPPSGCTFHPRCIDVMARCSQEPPSPIPTETGHVECHLYDADAAA
jgi:peptide/nickel transport system ATP-binding protein